LHEIDSGRASVGYWLLEGARGRGRATQALRGLVTFAFDALAIPRLHLFIEPWNVASAQTAESAGFRREAFLRDWERIDGQQRDADCFALLYRDWEGSG
jgi:RimJ/RimL family protein N-acetyltransferase